MSATETLISLFGAAALLLWGARMVRTGVVRAFGADLRHWLGHAARWRLGALGMGLVATVAMQSSTATAVMVASFTAGGLIATGPALAAMLGADIGTSLVAQALTFDLGIVQSLLVLGGVIVFLSGEGNVRRALARVAIGLGLMLLALKLIVAASVPLRDSPVVAEVLHALAREPALAVAIGALLTWLCHSSLACVLLVASLVRVGVVDLPLGFALVLGANLGGGLPALMATLPMGPAARRPAVGNLMFKLVGVVVALPLLSLAAPWIARVDTDAVRQIVNLHTAFNLALATLGIAFTGVIGRLCDALLPIAAKGEDPTRARYLDRSLLDTPEVALVNAARETLRMGDTVETMLRDSLEALRGADRGQIEAITARDDVVDALHEQIKLYVTALRREALDDAESRRCTEIITFTTNLEHIGDIIDKNLMELATKKARGRLRFSDEGFAEINALHARVLDNLQLALAVFVSDDAEIARRLLSEKVEVRRLERTASDNHMERLKAGLVESIETSAVHLDVLRDLKRIHSHIVAVAYPILERTGELAASRLLPTQASDDDTRPDGPAHHSAPSSPTSR
ncbi:MAG: Na/Pi cotransporter family protein [Alphaproteobacteria bacterium]|nr:Na/Pi cotransporter family protein [Alphaproteobacteria bacterium]